MATRIVGLDIGEAAIRVVAIDGAFRSFEFVEAFEEPVERPVHASDDPPPLDDDEHPADEVEAPVEAAPPLDEPQLAAIQRLEERGALECDRLVVNMSSENVWFTTLGLPFSDRTQIAAVLRPQLDGRLPVEVDELVFDFDVAAESVDGEYQVSVAATHEGTIEQFLGQLTDVGLDPNIVDVTPWPLWSAAAYLSASTSDDQEPRGPGIWIELATDSTRVVAFDGDRVLAARAVPIGLGSIADVMDIENGAGFTEHAAGALDLFADDGAEDEVPASVAARRALYPLARELRRTLRAAFAGTESEDEDNLPPLTLVGPGAEITGIDRWFTESVGITPQRPSFDRPEFERLVGFDSIGHRLVTALGLALRGTGTRPVSAYNLRQGRYAFRGNYDYLTERIPALSVMAGLLVFATVFFVFGRFALLRAEYNAVQEELAAATLSTFGETVVDANTVIDRVSGGGGKPSYVRNNSSATIVRELGSAIRAAHAELHPVTMTTVEVDMQRATFELGGYCDTAEATDSLLAHLESETCLDDVERVNLTERRSGSGYEFSFQGVVNCAEDGVVVADNTGGEQ